MPEKRINEIPKPLREQYEKGKVAYDRDNLDYAVTLFQNVLKQEPAFYECREALRATQLKRSGGGKSFFKKMLGSAGSSSYLAKGQLALRNNPQDALDFAESILNQDPNSVAGQKLLAEAALKCDLPRTAVLSYEVAYRKHPHDKDIALPLGEALIAAGNASRAEKILGELADVFPTDPEILQAAKDASAKRTMSDGGYDALADGTGSYRDILKDEAEAISLEQAAREVKTEDVADRLIQECTDQLAADPGNTKLTRKLAELHLQKGDFDGAIEKYKEVTDAEGGSDPALLKRIADVTARRYDHAIASLDAASSDYDQQLAKLQQEKSDYILNECQDRAAKYPTDLAIRYELGEIYFGRKNLTEAIGELQKAQNNPNLRLNALHLLGRCFAERGMNDLAAKTFQSAIAEKEVFDDLKKELIYALGSVLEKIGKAEEAIEQFKLIYEVDIAFQDVAAKIDAHYAQAE